MDFCPVFYQSLFPYTKQPSPVYESPKLGLPYTKRAFLVYGPFGVESENPAYWMKPAK